MSAARRIDATSPDGTRLAVWVEGDGPPLVLVHGSMHDHRANQSFVDALRSDVTTWSMDRRGFGASGDRAPWALEREFEDVAAAVDLAAVTGGDAGRSVALWGHSFGAAVALGGAALSDRVSHLVLYEPSLGLLYPPGSIDRVEAALTTGDHDRVITEVLTGVLEMPDDEVDAMRTAPGWADRLRTAPTVPRECRAEEAWTWSPGRFDAVGAVTLMLTGSESPAEL